MRKLIVLFCILASVCIAQDLTKLRISGKPELLQGELIDKSIRDKNGEVCAGLNIVSDISGLSFESNNGIVKVKRSVGSDLLYLSPDEQIVKVRCYGYDILTIYLNEESIKLHSGEVWQIKVTGDKKLDLIPINIITTPKDALVFIDNLAKGTGTTFETSPGEHTVRIELKGYETKIIVSPKNILFNYNLKAIKQEVVEIRSVPNGATIYMDGVQEGETDNQLFRFPGKYKMKLSKSSYLDHEKEIEVKKGVENKFSITLVKNISSINLTVTPYDAEVIINNKSYGQSRNIELAPGNHLLVVKKNGYKESSENITLELNQPVRKSISLEPITGILQVKIIPIDASVKLIKDGKEISSWKGAKILDELMVGSYTLECNLEGYNRSIQSLEILESKPVNVEIKLTSTVLANDNDETIAYEGKIYHTVKIGTQVWLKENLDVGTMIQVYQIQSDNERIEKYCYDNIKENCNTYGGLYQWNEAMAYNTTPGTKGICPDGWHIPTLIELQTLGKTVSNNGNALKAIGQGIESGVGTNTSGFSSQLAGYRLYDSSFLNLGYATYFWSSIESNAPTASLLSLHYYNNNVYFYNYNVENGFSVRCLKDN